MIEDKVWDIHEKAKKKLLHENRIQKLHPVMQKVYTASDWVSSLKYCIEGTVQALGDVVILCSSLTEDVNKAEFIINLKNKINEVITISYKLSSEFSFIMNRKYQPLTIVARKKIDTELEQYWEKLKTALESAKKEIRALKGKAMMVDVWDTDEVKPLHKFFDRVLDTNINEIQKRFMNGEMIFGDDMDDIDDHL